MQTYLDGTADLEPTLHRYAFQTTTSIPQRYLCHLTRVSLYQDRCRIR
ncbi:protein of unknown function [Methylocaldum szegediense]|uniref:Uncharacterized protein n=1 Tax=Methylocaldum szegediense TaxID=73780 RepID=A0ABM9I902_9GAMM|nr:protein of unknown function [Methylocaldum szegediense]